MSDLRQLERQWMVLKMLSARHYGVTLRELAEETSVSEKTIRRDLQLLARVGFPVNEAVGEHGRKHWQMKNGQPVPFAFTLEEVVSLYLGRRFLEPLAGTYFWDGAQSAFRKIRATLGETALQYLEKVAAIFHQTAFGAGDYSKKARTIDALMVGIEDRRFTTITYHPKRATEPITYDVYPYGLVFHRGALYLVAFSPERGRLRHFKVDRMEAAETQDLRFVKPADFDLRKHLAGSFGIWDGEGSRVRVTVRFQPAVVRFVEERCWHPSQELTRQRDGSLLARFELSSTEEIKSWILGFGAAALVLDPERLREEIAAEVRRMTELYQAFQPSGSPGRLRMRRRS